MWWDLAFVDVSESVVPDEKGMRLRYAGTCRVCSVKLPKGSDAVYERSTKSVRCVSCVVPIAAAAEPAIQTERAAEDVDSGVPGASARREFERRHARREERVRSKHKRLGGAILALSDDPQSTRAWDTRAVGEERLSARLNELAGHSLRVLHDRRIPRSTASIDHFAIAPTDVYVIDAKRFRGRPGLIVEGGLIPPRVEKLIIAGRDRSKLLDGVLKQAELVGVRGSVGDDIPVRGVLCFVEADWPLIGGPFVTRDVDVLWPKKLYPRLQEQGHWPHVTSPRCTSCSRELRPA